MLTKEIILHAADGLHARPAGELVKLVKSFDGTYVNLSAAGKKATAASMLGILALGLKSGTPIEITAQGPREEEAAEAVYNLISQL